MTALAICKRELLGYFLSPISYVVLTLFLIVQGYSFFLLCEVLQSRQAMTGVVMQYYFGGTFLYWLFQVFVVAVLTMRLLAEERQQGTLEPLLSAPVREEAVVLGKYAAAVVFYLFLWAPTLAYVGLLSAYASDAAPISIDKGPIAAGYLGTLLYGLSSLALGLLCSAVSASLVLSAVLCFSLLSLLLLVGMLADLYVRGEAARQVLLHINLFHHMDELSRGIVDTRRVAYHLSVAACALFITARLLKARPGDVRRLSRAALEGLLCLALLVGVNGLAARHGRRLDWTRSQHFTLSQKLRDLLSDLAREGREAQVVVFLAAEAPDPTDHLLEDTRELLLRASQAAGGRLKVEQADPERDRDRARVLAARYKLDDKDLIDGGLVVAAGDRHQFIPRGDLALYGSEPDGSVRIQAYRGEEALATALLTVLTEQRKGVCFTRGHGEPEHDSMTRSGLSDLSRALHNDGYQVRALTEWAGCDVVAIVGPERPFLAQEVAALEGYLDRGGRLLLLAGAALDRGLTRFVDLGLEPVLAKRGIRLGQALVLDPETRHGQSLAWTVEEGYADHPVTAAFMHRRTLWQLARPVLAVPPAGEWSAQPLILTGEQGFGETSLGDLQRGHVAYDEGQGDLKGPVAVAAVAEVRKEKGGRIVAFGSAQLGQNGTMAFYNRDLILSAVAYLADAQRKVVIEPRHLSSLRLALDGDQERRLLLVTLVGMPLMGLLLGLGVFWIRRS
jgi:ABC-2 type transport system permease protein